MTHRTNTDQFTYLPGRYLCGNQKLRRVPTPSMRRAPDSLVDFHTGRYFACAVRTRFSLSFGHKWVAEILSLSGVNRPSGPLLYGASPVGTCVEIKFYGAFATCTPSNAPDTLVDFHADRDAERLEEGLPGELQTRRLRVAVCVEIKLYGAFVLNRRVELHAVAATLAL